MCVCVGSAQFLGEASRLSGSFSPKYGRSVRLLCTVCVFDDGCSRGASSVTLSSAPRVLFDARPVRQDESTSKMSHRIFSSGFYCVEKFPVCCWFVCGVVSLCASLKQHDDGPHADAAPRFLSYFQQRSENE